MITIRNYLSGVWPFLCFGFFFFKSAAIRIRLDHLIPLPRTRKRIDFFFSEPDFYTKAKENQG